MSIWTALILGLLVGWLVEWLIDWLYWRNRYAALAANLEAAQAQNTRLRADLNAANGSLGQLKTELDTLNTNFVATKVANDRLHVELDTVNGSLKQCKTECDRLSLAAAQAENDQLHVRLSAPDSAMPQPSNGSSELHSQAGIHQFAFGVKDQSQRDPLIDINGIGPVFEKRLFEAGVYTFADLVAQDPERLREIVAAQSWQDVDPQAWIAEAQQFIAAGKNRGQS